MADAEDRCIDVALAHLLRGGEFSLSGYLDSMLPSVSVRVAYHGIAGLLSQLALDRLPPSLAEETRQMAVSQLFWEVEHLRRLRPLLKNLTECGASPILFKGTALAYTRYTEASARSRGDSDILVREGLFEKCCEIVRSHGFEPSVTGLSVHALGAKSFSLRDQRGFNHEIDLHQRINSSAVIARLFPHEELLDYSEPVLQIGSAARALGPVHALLVACFHRLIHDETPYYVDGKSYRSSDRLIWLYDIKLLYQKLSDVEKDRLHKLAQEKGLTQVLAEGLAAADQWLDLGTRGQFLGPNMPRATELPYRYLKGGLVKRRLLDLAATRHKGRAFHDLLIPSREYMTSKYGPTLLKAPVLAYVWRAIHGIYKVTAGKERGV